MSEENLFLLFPNSNGRVGLAPRFGGAQPRVGGQGAQAWPSCPTACDKAQRGGSGGKSGVGGGGEALGQDSGHNPHESGQGCGPAASGNGRHALPHRPRCPRLLALIPPHMRGCPV